MTFLLKQTFKMLAIAGLVSGLAACGGGGDGTLVTQDLKAVTVSAATEATAEQYAKLLVNKTASLPVGAIFTEAGAPTVAANTSFTFTPIPAGAPANAISGFTLNSAQGTFSGYIAAGSTILCGKGTWGGTTYPIPPSTGDANGNACFTINGNMVLDPNTDRLVAGTQNVDITVTITGAGTTSRSTVSTSVTVTYSADGTTATITDSTGNSFVVDTVVVTGSVTGANT
ncbi:hypothetical protein C6P61_12880 [Malikia spinosa]|uniref:Uncharacterized protein n=1 Tax=Malikia spinosa TaxID=86180 RepID=A0A2S9KCE1_9BURK|nr:hypothetical protein [Malikia spinosa]PRD68065.1 hypothetical protein C6P61_12880 [Malikia spinosa]